MVNSSTLNDLKSGLIETGDLETKLRFEIIDLEKTGAEYQAQLGRLTSEKAKIDKRRSKNRKNGYTGAVAKDNENLTEINNSIKIINAVIEAHNSKLRSKRKQLKAAIENSTKLTTKIAEQNQEEKIAQQKQAEQAASDRELAKYAGVPTPCIKNMLVSRLANGNTIIHYCGVGSKTGIRCKKRIITPDRLVYRQDENDKEPILIPRGR